MRLGSAKEAAATRRVAPTVALPSGSTPVALRESEEEDSTATAVRDSILDSPRTVRAVAGHAGVNEDLLALQIDRSLNSQVWAGTTTQDRLARVGSILKRSLFEEIEKSLYAQESYDEFEARMMRSMGVGPVETRTGNAALRAMDLAVETEARLGWGEGMRAANQAEDTIEVWRARMDDRTTAGCWNNHGKPMTKARGPLPRHPRCRCEPYTIPDPNSADPKWAKLGRDIMADMEAERESGEGLEESVRVRVLKPSRFASFREAA